MSDVTQSPHWRWMSQMRDEGGNILVSIDADSGFGLWVSTATDSELEAYGMPRIWADAPVEWGSPDLDDPATQGCMLRLVREAWDALDIDLRMYPDGAWKIIINADGFGFAFEADTLGEVLEAALLAAPEKP